MATVTQRWVRRGRDVAETWLARSIQFVSVQLGKLTPAVQTRVVRGVQLALEVHLKSRTDELSVYAAALTYNCFLSMLPLALVGLSLTGFFFEPESADWTQRILEAVPGLSEIASEKLTSLQSTRTSLGVIGLIGALWVGSTLTSRAQRALDKTFGAHENFVLNRVRAIGVSIALGAVLLSTLALTGYVSSISADGLIALPVALAIRIALVIVMLGYWVMAYWLLTPTRSVRVRDHLTGAVFMTVGFELLRLIGGWYVGRFVVRASALYGAIGAVFGLLVFIRLAMWLFLYGAEVSAILRDQIRWPSRKADLRRDALQAGDRHGQELVER
jgi:membrane protein